MNDASAVNTNASAHIRCTRHKRIAKISAVMPRAESLTSAIGSGIHPLVVPVPLAREAALRIEALLLREEEPELRIRRLDLLAPRPAVIGQEVAATARDREIDERAERVRRLRERGLVV